MAKADYFPPLIWVDSARMAARLAQRQMLQPILR